LFRYPIVYCLKEDKTMNIGVLPEEYFLRFSAFSAIDRYMGFGDLPFIRFAVKLLPLGMGI
jgi:hypothetical protein